mmetsp:Transcript_9333/g.27693  ORF Transcript_9333/g.27693 Transcript_9333/m.27693 type:complete len:309 (-) Transcript_9333:45-971(-)
MRSVGMDDESPGPAVLHRPACQGGLIAPGRAAPPGEPGKKGEAPGDDDPLPITEAPGAAPCSDIGEAGILGEPEAAKAQPDPRRVGVGVGGARPTSWRLGTRGGSRWTSRSGRATKRLLAPRELASPRPGAHAAAAGGVAAEDGEVQGVAAEAGEEDGVVACERSRVERSGAVEALLHRRLEVEGRSEPEGLCDSWLRSDPFPRRTGLPRSSPHLGWLRRRRHQARRLRRRWAAEGEPSQPAGAASSQVREERFPSRVPQVRFGSSQAGAVLKDCRRGPSASAALPRVRTVAMAGMATRPRQGPAGGR